MFGSSAQDNKEILAEIQETAHAVTMRTQCSGCRKRATVPQTPPRSPSPSRSPSLPKDADANGDDNAQKAGGDELEYAG